MWGKYGSQHIRSRYRPILNIVLEWRRGRDDGSTTQIQRINYDSNEFMNAVILMCLFRIFFPNLKNIVNYVNKTEFVI